MRNKFSGICYKCGLLVAPGTGYFERHAGGWRVQHCYRAHNGGVTCAMAQRTALPGRDKTSQVLNGSPVEPIS